MVKDSPKGKLGTEERAEIDGTQARRPEVPCPAEHPPTAHKTLGTARKIEGVSRLPGKAFAPSARDLPRRRKTPAPLRNLDGLVPDASKRLRLR